MHAIVVYATHMHAPCITIDFYISTRILNSTRDCIIARDCTIDTF